WKQPAGSSAWKSGGTKSGYRVARLLLKRRREADRLPRTGEAFTPQLSTRPGSPRPRPGCTRWWSRVTAARVANQSAFHAQRVHEAARVAQRGPRIEVVADDHESPTRS